jgi:Bacterial Ig-like domain
MDSQANHARERRRLGAADRSHPIRSTIFAAITAALATIALVVASNGKPAEAASSLVNGNLETGDLTGWTIDTPAYGGNASAVASYDYYYKVPCTPENSYGGPCYDIATVRPHEGSYFALLTSGYQQSAATKISQPFEASNGEKVSGWAFFQTGNHESCNEANNDKAQVVITSASGTTVATPFEQSTRTVYQPQYNSGWRYWEHTFSGLTGPGQFQIEARVQNNAGTGGVSSIGLDDVKTSTEGGPDTTLPETYITSGPCGVTDSTSATFEFHSNEQDSTFKCQLSKEGTVLQQWEDCTSPKSYSNLTRHKLWETSYRFEVKATDPTGNVDPTPASRHWFVDTDTTAPTLVSTVPKADATVVDRTTNITATFSEEMDDSSISGQTFKLFKKGSTTQIATEVTYPDPNSPPYTAKLDPTNSLRSGVTYKAVVTTGARDLVGHPIDQQKVWFFTVR